MPTIAVIGHVRIRMFADDHNPPHFHIMTVEHQGLMRISDLALMVGSMDRKSMVSAAA